MVQQTQCSVLFQCMHMATATCSTVGLMKYLLEATLSSDLLYDQVTIYMPVRRDILL